MDESSLVNSLSQRLSELEHKVHTFRHEVAADFLRYYHDLLRDTQPDITSNVAQSLAKSLSNYPDLSSVLTSLDLDLTKDAADSRTLTRPESDQRHFSPPTTVATSGSGAAEPPGSPRDRHHELLFFLPLLEGSPPRTPTSPPQAFLTNNHTPIDMLLPEPSIQAEEKQGAATVKDQQSEQPGIDQAQNALPAAPHSPGRPGHVRRSTNDTVSSFHSDRSESKTPRSALRRSSSGSKPPQSPRRVRFDVMGAEVLPTASPQPNDSMLPPAAPAPPADQPRTESMLGDDLDYLPPPRKISSSEALRALSREPLEDGVWTEVNSTPDQTSSVEEKSHAVTASFSPEERSSPMIIAPEPPLSRYVPESVRIERTLGSVSEEPNEDQDSSDDDFLSMAKPKSFSTKKPPGSPSLNKIPEEIRDMELAESPESPTKFQSSGTEKKAESVENDDEDVDEDDELFHFEESGGSFATPKSKSKPKPKPLPLEEEAEVDLPDVPESEQSLYATSPAVQITRRPGSSGPTTPAAARFQAGSVGSYKGRPVVMHVVRNPEVHAQAASLGHFNTFVGGLDGRSGMDEGDLSSFRASVANTGFSGTPRSFTERLMMEEAQKARAGGSRLS
ncbi:Ff.00g124670.m01.CDS01 [Fusarium sp. VM40]|nr:Ff.00g124670.m01.CDS01 [Fusarium sp. VM40]